MGRRSNCVVAAEQVEHAIANYCATGRGRHRSYQALLGELLRYVALQQEPKRLPSLGRKWTRLRREVQSRHPTLTYASYLLGTRERMAAKLKQEGLLRTHDAAYLLNLSARAGVSLEHLAKEAPAWAKARAEAERENLTVLLDDRAVEDLLLAALESYAVSPPGRGRRYTEVYGLCFGTSRTRTAQNSPTHTLLSVERVVTQLRAVGTASSVSPNDKSARIHRTVAERFFAKLELLGDYHTHPWASLSTLESKRGWQLSRADREHIRGWVQEDHGGARPRFCLVVAITRGKRTGTFSKRLEDNRIRFSVHGYFIHVAAYRIQQDGECTEQVRLACSHLSEGPVLV